MPYPYSRDDARNEQHSFNACIYSILYIYIYIYIYTHTMMGLWKTTLFSIFSRVMIKKRKPHFRYAVLTNGQRWALLKHRRVVH